MKISKDCLISPLLQIRGMLRVQKFTNRAMKMSRYKYWLFLLCFFAVMQLAAQQTQEFTGRVTDQTGAVVRKASILAHNLDTGVDKSTTTTSTGDYTIPYVIPGRYVLSVQASGFQTAVRTGIVLQVDQIATVNFTLSVGSVSMTVTVDADALLDISKADNGVVIENARVNDLPINGRNPGMLAILAPGALYEGSWEYTAPFDSNDANMSVNGGGQGGVALMLNGISNQTSPINNSTVAEIAYVPPVDAVQEFKIITNPYDAQYGLMAGAVEDVTLKTGTNKLHGDVYEFARRQWLDANLWQNDWYIKTAKAGTDLSSYETPQMKWDQYGIEADGPLTIHKFHDVHSKTFFTVQYENFHELQPDPQTASVPSSQWLDGDFSNLVYWDGSAYAPKAIYDPESISCSNNPGAKSCSSGTWVRQQFGPGNSTSASSGTNIIPSGRINSQAKAIMKLYPAPNLTPATGADPFKNNYFVEGKDEIRYRNALIKLDRNWTDNDSSTLTYGYWNRVELRNGNGLSGPVETGWKPLGERQHAFTFNHIHTFSPTLILDFRASVQARDDFTYQGAPFNPANIFEWSSSLISQLGSSATTEFPYLSFSDNTSMGTNSNTNAVKDTLAFFPTLTWIKQKHTFHAGVDLRFWQLDNNVVSGGANFYTDKSWTQSQCSSCAGGVTEQSAGNDIVAFLLGVPTSGGNSNNPTTFYSAHYYAPFVQDDWKVTKKLTLNLGLRYDLVPDEVERHNKGNYAFDTIDANPISNDVNLTSYGYGQIKGGITFLGTNGNPRQTYSLTKTNIQPRFGFAYVLNDKTVLRGGFGVSVRTPSNAPTQYGYSANTSYVSSDSNYPSGVMPNTNNPINNPFSSVVQPKGSSLGLETALGQGIGYLNPHYKTPKFWNYSLGFERQLSAHDVINVSYVGTRLYDGDSSDNINHQSASAIEAKNCNPDKGGQWENCNNYNVTNPFAGISAFSGTSDYSASTLSGFVFTQPYPQFGSVTEYQENQYRTWYNSLQVVADHRMSRGFSLHGTWTYSRLMDAGGWRDTTYRVPYRSLDSNDHSHVITVSGVYNLPVGQGRTIGSNMPRLLDIAVGGWQLGGLFTLESGAPWQLGNKYMLHSPYVKPHIQKSTGYIRMVAACVEQWNDSTDTNGKPVYTMQQLSYDYDGTCTNGADMENQESWMPTPNNVSQGIRLLRNDNVDMSISKSFMLPEKLRMQIRLDAFNLPNHPLWAESPNGTIQDSTFGEIEKGPSGQSNTPRQMQIAAKIIW